MIVVIGSQPTLVDRVVDHPPTQRLGAVDVRHDGPHPVPPLDEVALDLLHERQADDALARGERVVGEYGHGWYRAGSGRACPPWPSTVQLRPDGQVERW